MDSEEASESRPPSGGSHVVRSHRVRRPRIRALIWANILLAAWISVGTFLFVIPAADLPERSDAIVVLAPVLSTGRLEYAERLMTEGFSTTLVLSVPGYGSTIDSPHICHSNRSYSIICFSPAPETTQGEARAIQRLSEEYGWRNITVVTSDFHITRARAIIERCYPYQLNMAAVWHDRSFTGWAYRLVYESAAFVKATVLPTC